MTCSGFKTQQRVGNLNYSPGTPMIDFRYTGTFRPSLTEFYRVSKSAKFGLDLASDVL